MVQRKREVVADPKGRPWSVALMDVLGQEGDPDRPNDLLTLQYSQEAFRLPANIKLLLQIVAKSDKLRLAQGRAVHQT